MSMLGDILKWFKFAREERREERRDHREERADERANRQELLILIDQRIENAEHSLSLVSSEGEGYDLIAAIKRYRELKSAILDQLIQSHAGLPSREGASTEVAAGSQPQRIGGPATTSVQLDSATVMPGGTVTLPLRATAPRAGIGAYTIDVLYDRALVRAISCTSNTAGVCNSAFGPNMVRFAGASATGIVGQIELGTITFQAGSHEGEAVLRVNVEVLVDPYLRDFAQEVVIRDGRVFVKASL